MTIKNRAGRIPVTFGESRMNQVIIAIVLSMLMIGSANATGIWAITGQVILSGTPIGSVPASSAINAAGNGRFYTEADCEKALKKLMAAPVVRATSSPQGLYHTGFTVSGGVTAPVEGTEMQFSPVAGVAKTVMADCVEVANLP